jgi:hypothetical protein
MSKKHKKNSYNQTGGAVAMSHAAEYQIIKHDLLKVVVLNAIYLAGVVALYYSNVKYGFLEQWFSKILHL